MIELTGGRRRDAQIRWLVGRGWRFEINCKGRPVVARSYFDARLGDVKAIKPPGPVLRLP
jgi:hypothetical protein